MVRNSKFLLIFGITIIGIFGSTQIAFALPFVLDNGPGDGTISLGVNGYGGFGANNGPDASDALYDPVGGGVDPAQTTLGSAIAIRLGTEVGDGSRAFLTTGFGLFGSGGLGNPTVSGTPTSATSSFTSNGLQFNLIQTLTKTFTGTTLTQTYTITNPTSSTIDFELLRYLDGDLQFDSSIDDGGGRLVNSDAVEILFETDGVGGSSTFTTFIGVTSEGGTVPITKRYEMNAFPNFGSGISNGGADLLNDIFNDNADLDEFIDTAYDVSLALRNEFSLDENESVVYVTKTVFGSGTPDDAEIDPPTMVGGMILPIDTVAILIVGAQSITWIIPITLSIVGIGLVFVKRR